MLSQLSKPILHNGYKLASGQVVLARRDNVELGEIYQLGDGTYLFLYTQLKASNVVSDKHMIITMNLAGRDIVGVVSKEYSLNKFQSVYTELIEYRGFAAVAGMDELKQMLIDEVINPLRNPEKFKKFNVSIPNGILLYGPPGCGKTFIVRKLSEELDYNFFEISHSDVASPYIHGTVEKIGQVFEAAKRAAPAIVFIDELSGLVPDREFVTSSNGSKEEEVNQFLMELNDAADHNILVVGATNFIDKIDKAILRPGRIDKKILVSPPDHAARKELFKISLRNRPHEESISFAKLADLTDGYTSSDIVEGIVENVARRAVNLDRQTIDEELITEEIDKYNPYRKEVRTIGFKVD